ncbi:TetR/AcrR family transcriptional regulator [Allofournierella sp.]|uniref:TetR/AcrR family transcriptional regulator n=1 Tax=Allofournierella sp. TaxID=1940256 RepID=UPI003AB8FB38
MPGRLQQQKEVKKQSLLTAANELFLEKGVSKTSIDDIVKRAQVAKGTFYLYFKDKSELQQALVLRISTRVLNEAYAAVHGRGTGDFIEDLLLFIDHIIEQFKRDKLTLRLLERNFSWPAVARELSQGTDPLWQNLMKMLQASPLAAHRTEDELFKLVFIIVEMCGSTCYSSIIEHRPDTIDNMKPVLYDIIRRALA